MESDEPRTRICSRAEDAHSVRDSMGSIVLTHAGAAPAINSARRFKMGSTVPEIPAPSVRTRVVREPHRGVYQRETIDKILDEGFVCHIGFQVDGQPYVIPTMYARIGDSIYFHGSAASRMLRNASSGVPVCLTVTLIDGLVLARSVFNHSMNYRSVVVLGTATLVDASAEKLEALRGFTERILPGRWKEARQPNEKELKATSILRLSLTEASAKVRVGPPEDDADDYALPIWAGVIPMHLAAGAPIRDERCDAAIPVPGYAEQYRR
jgi:nitroimidazol reductase NimA-like FMN-containing flavoprotein (pyridoxamine 5'-phosphate oxidase superfamily)